MAMIAGSVVVTGGVASGTGLSKEIYDAVAATITWSGTPADQGSKKGVADLANAIASTVIAHITAHAVVSVTTNGTVAAGIPVSTAGSAAAQTGATTGPGSETGSGSGTVA